MHYRRRVPWASRAARHRRECAAVVHAWAEAFQRREVLGHRIAHVALETVAGMRGTDASHQPVARHLGDDGCCRDREHQRIAADHRNAIA